MSIVTNQPLPYGRLERENHIRMIFRAFQNKCGPVCECHSDPPACKSLQMSGKPVPGLLRSEDGAGGSTNSLSVLDEVTQFHVTARPQLQGERRPLWASGIFVDEMISSEGLLIVGPQCVPQRIYSIATGANRSQLFVVVEGTIVRLMF